MKSFDSLVYSMMQKVLDKGVPLNIYLPHGQTMVRDEEVKGEVFSVQWWSTEGILNIQYQFRDEGDNLRTRDYRVRPVSGKMFDDTYTLKKVDGVLTLVRKPKEELDEAKKPKAPAEELNMAGQLAMRTIQKWHEEDRPVHLDINAHRGVMVRGPLLNISPVDDGYTLQVQLPEGWTSSGWVGPNRINRFKLTVGTAPNGVKQLQVTMREKELEEELDDTTEPLWSSMLRKLLNADKVVRFSSEKKGHRGERTVFNVEFSRTPSGRPMVEVEHTNLSALPASIFFVGSNVTNVELKKIDGEWWLIDNNTYDYEAD